MSQQRKNNKDRIQIACRDLESALSKFESQIPERPRQEQETIVEMKKTLKKIKDQIDGLS